MRPGRAGDPASEGDSRSQKGVALFSHAGAPTLISGKRATSCSHGPPNTSSAKSGHRAIIPFQMNQESFHQGAHGHLPSEAELQDSPPLPHRTGNGVCKPGGPLGSGSSCRPGMSQPQPRRPVPQGPSSPQRLHLYTRQLEN